MEDLTLNAQTRVTLGKKVKKIRQQGKLPMVLYGKGIDSQPLTTNMDEFNHIFQKSGASTLVNLQIDENKSIKVLIHEPQRDPINNKILHADIYKVNMAEKIRTEIPLHFIGESLAVTDLEGNLITNRDSIEVECLPDALITSIEVDISSLKTFEDIIHIKDIKIPENIEVLNDPEETIILVTPPRSEEELADELAETTQEEEKAAVAELEGEPTTEGETTENKEDATSKEEPEPNKEKTQ